MCSVLNQLVILIIKCVSVRLASGSDQFIPWRKPLYIY